jgi:hypothetical protein
MSPTGPELPLQDDLVDQAIRGLRNDLLTDRGQRINTMPNHPFAILPYPPELEYSLRRRINHLVIELRAHGWGVLQVDMHRLLLDRVTREGEAFRDAVIAQEQRLFARDPQRALNYLADTLADLVEGPDGLAQDVVQQIDLFAQAHPERAGKTVVFLGRLGALYPIARSSALLKHIDGRTRSLPVVLLYPGIRSETSALSFMGVLPLDRDYRPRIYP